MARVSDAKTFRSGRQWAGGWGLVPRQKSRGDKDQLLRIRKPGHTYLRTLLIHGAWSGLFRINCRGEPAAGMIDARGRSAQSEYRCCGVSEKTRWHYLGPCSRMGEMFVGEVVLPDFYKTYKDRSFFFDAVELAPR
jgi:hypothetical protein